MSLSRLGQSDVNGFLNHWSDVQVCPYHFTRVDKMIPTAPAERSLPLSRLVRGSAVIPTAAVERPLRASFSPAHPLARRDVLLAMARAFESSPSLVKGVAKAALYCAHRTSTF